MEGDAGRTLLVAAEVEGCEFDVADGEFFGGWVVWLALLI